MVNHMLSIAYNYSMKWKFEFNLDKSLVMIWGLDKLPGQPILFGDKELKTVDKIKHMGVLLTSYNSAFKDNFKEKIAAGKNCILAARGLGSPNVPVSPRVLSKIYWCISIPRITYGLEVTPVKDNHSIITEMEQAHRQIAKLIQCLPQNISKPACLVTLGWMSMESYVILKKISFLWQVLNLPDEHIYKITALYTIHQCQNRIEYSIKCSPIADAWHYVSRLNLDTKILGESGTGEIASKYARKRLLKRVVWELDYKRWQATKLCYPELELFYECIKNINMHPWWSLATIYPHLVHKIGTIISILMGGQPKGMLCNMNSKLCKLCSYRARDDVTHLLFECEGLKTIQDTGWATVILLMTEGMRCDMERLTYKEKSTLILSCYGNTFIPDWTDLYAATLNFVHLIYQKRADMYKAIGTDSLD